MKPGTRLVVVADEAALDRAVAEHFVAAAGQAIAARGSFAVALSGGTTPKAVYALLAVEPLRSAVDWANVRFFFGDERCVPPGDAESNFKSADDGLLRPLGIPARQIFRMRGEDEPAVAAREYATVLREELGPSPVFDLVMLGMGPDGHTASLFPGTSALAEEDRLAVAVDVAEMGTRRLTLTYPALCGAREVCFLVTGREKAAALATVVEAGHLPAARIVRRAGPVTIFCDREAASTLTTGFLKK